MLGYIDISGLLQKPDGPTMALIAAGGFVAWANRDKIKSFISGMIPKKKDPSPALPTVGPDPSWMDCMVAYKVISDEIEGADINLPEKDTAREAMRKTILPIIMKGE